MTPQQALTTLYDMLAQLQRLAPVFHTREDTADLAEAQWALSDVANRLAVQVAQDTAAQKETR